MPPLNFLQIKEGLSSEIYRVSEIVSSDPGNYRGIFLLDVAGKVLAKIIELRKWNLTEDWLDDMQNGFRTARSTSHSVHVPHRLQEG
jgi:hypothetical protein